MIAAIVPAAGLSRRMGVPKQLLPFGRTNLLGHVVAQLLGSRVDGVYVVVGHEAERVRAALAGQPVHIVSNPDYQQGDMLSSVRCGLRALPADCTAALVALGDQPAITAELVDAMLDAFVDIELRPDPGPGRPAGPTPAAGKGIIVPTHDGKRGHPLLLARQHFAEVLSSFDDVGLRGLLAAHPQDVFDLPASNPAVLSDVDFPEDYRRELARARRPG